LPYACSGDVVRYTVEPSLDSSIFNWVVQGGKIINSTSRADTVDILWKVKPNNYSVGVCELALPYYGFPGCTGDTVYSYVQVRSAVAMLEDQSICAGQEATFDGGQGNKYFWGSKNNTLPFIDTLQRYVTLSKPDTIWVRLVNRYNCSAIDTAVLTVHPIPTIKLGRDTMLCNQDELILDVGNTWKSIMWSTDEISNSIIVKPVDQAKTISVTVSNDYGCEATDTIQILACIPPTVGQIPTAFVPNSHFNPTWKIPVMVHYPEASVEVYDRWGRMVFKSTKGYTEAWDGRSGGRSLPMDTYYYVIDLHNGQPQLVGTVTILK